MLADENLLDNLIDRIAEAVVDKIEQWRKIDLIAEAVLARLEEQGLAKGQEETTVEEVREEVKAAPRARKPTKRRGKKGDKVTR